MLSESNGLVVFSVLSVVLTFEWAYVYLLQILSISEKMDHA